MRTPPHPDDPEPPGMAGVRPYLRGGAPPPTLPPPQASPSSGAAGGGPPGRADDDGPGEQTANLRPFVITAGRVDAPDPDIGIETQVTAHPGAVPARLPPEKRAIVALCAQPLSVAEISARLRLHLGVTRILVGDLRAAGQLDVHVLDNDFPDPETILRVIRGLRAIS